MRNIENRIERLEEIQRMRPACEDPVTMATLDLLSDDELAEVGGLFRSHGAEWTADLPLDAQARVLALLANAKDRAVQSSNTARARPGETRG